MRLVSPFQRLLVAAFALALSAASAPALTVPTGFTVDDATPSALWDTPVAVAFVPDGRLFVAEKSGLLWAVTNGVKASTPLWDGRMEVLDQHDRGFLGLAVDPNYLANHYVYFMYTVDPDSDGFDDEDEAWGRLTRYRVSFADSTKLDPASRTVLFGTTWSDGPLIASPSHTVGCLRFGRDGTLLCSMGDGANYDQVDAGNLDPNAFLPGRVDSTQNIGAYRAQLITSMDGKILRLDPLTGQGLPSNPFWDDNPASVRSRVWAYGVRNPFRFCVRPNTGSTDPAAGRPGHLFIGDVGWYQYEEINVSRTGGENFGWPCYEGIVNTDQFRSLPQNQRWICDSLGTSRNPATFVTTPLVVESHNTPGLSIPQGFIGNAALGGQFYTGTLWPVQYRDKYYAVDFGQNWLKMATVDTSGNLLGWVDFATGLNGPVDVEVDPQSGDLYYVSIYTNQIRRIRWVGGGQGGNLPPVVKGAGLPDVGVAPLTVNFSSVGTFDDNGDTLAYSWNFGDQSGSPLPNPQHVYTIPGEYDVVLTVDDGHGGVGRANLHISVAATSDFPTSGILDNFERPSGGLGGLWSGDVSGMQIANGQLQQIQLSNSIVLNTPQAFGATQECYVTIARMTPQAPEHNLMLKVQGSTWDAGHIEVRYDGLAGGVVISTYSPNQSWVQRGGLIPCTLQDGDQFGARAYSTGLVVAYKNGVPLGQADCSGWTFSALGGRLGMTLTGASSSLLDNFGGGTANLNSNTAPVVQILRPDTTWAVAGDTLQLACSATDAQQADSTLTFRWDVDILHNTHVHPSAYTSPARTGRYVVDNHDDGTGVFFLVRVKATDSGNLSTSDTVYVFPEIDETPRGLAFTPSAPNDGQPTTIAFRLVNLGRMPAHRAHWRMLLDGAIAAEGDTLVAARDSITLAASVGTLASGNHVVRVVADTLGAITETNESNNTLTQTFAVVHVTLAVGDVPRMLALSGAWPNPSSGRANFSLDLPHESPVELTVLDLQGRVVWNVPARTFGPGRWTLGWDGSTSAGARTAAGLYLVRVRVGEKDFTRRLVILL